MSALFELVRQSSLPAIWSQGVKLARQNAVTREPKNGDGDNFRVKAPGHVIAPTVTLYPDHQEWTCDCGGKLDPCAHVVAAAIAAQAPEPANGSEPAASAGTAASGTGNTPALAAVAPPANGFAPSSSAKRAGASRSGTASARPAARAAALASRGSRVEYRLSTQGRLLTLLRLVVQPDGSEQPLYTLASDLARGRLPEDLRPTHEDLTIDRVRAGSRREDVVLEQIPLLFAAMSKGATVQFRGAPIRIREEAISPRARLDDADDGGFVLTIERDPLIDEVVAFGVGRAGNALVALRETTLSGLMLEHLPLSRRFTRAQSAELVTRILPELEAKLPLSIVAKGLPRANRLARPRIAFDWSYQGHSLSVLPTLVYGDPPVLRIDGDQAVALGNDAPHRRPSEEKDLVQRLRDQLNLVPGRRVDFDGPEAARVATKVREFQRRLGGVTEATMEAPLLEARVVIEGDSFDVVFEVPQKGAATGETRRADARAVLHAFRDGLDLVPLLGGGFARLPAGFLAEHGARVQDLLAARGESKVLPKAAFAEVGALCEALDLPPPPAFQKLRPLLDDFSGLPRTKLPDGVMAELRHYQEQGVDWLSFARDAELGAVLADDMGLGKTLQTICVLKGRALVVCPKSVVHNWAAEIARFRPSLRTAVYHGAERELDHTADVTLTTYAVLRLDLRELASEDWDIVVLDEAQAIKNADSQTARAAFGLKARWRVALSGTPVENRLEELFSVMHFTNPGLLGGRADFQSRYATPIAAGNPEAGQRLRNKIRPFVLRRLKRDVLPELPPRTDSLLYVELDEGERAVYDAVRAATQKDVLEKLSHGGSVLHALEALLRLRQAACHSALVPGQVAERSSKIDRLLETLEELVAEEHKALVFSQWTSLLDRVEPALQAAGLGYLRLDGSTRDRAGVVAKFQSDDGPPVLLISLKAGGTGLNLTAADHVFLLDPWWNPAVEDQAKDRAHRIGQERPVMVYRMVAKDTVEERILALQDKKRALVEVALGEASAAGALTRQDLLDLLS
jgi:superfamily II DNA or RNA helicase